jgi:hypothetical protein
MAQAGSETVYKCRGENGRIVFQQVACDESNVTGDSVAHNLWRKMRALSSEGKNILSSLGADVESIKQCKRDILVFNEKVDALSSSVDQVARNYKNLVKAHGYLKDCGVCRTSAEANCRTADKYLDQAVSKLTEY